MISCPPDAALRDCQGCRIKPECKADMRLYQQIQAARKRRPVIIAEEPIPQEVRIKAVSEIIVDGVHRVSLRRMK